MKHRGTRPLIAAAAVAAVVPISLVSASAAGDQTYHRGAYVARTHVPGGYTRSLAVDAYGGDHWIAGAQRYYTLFRGDRHAHRDVSHPPQGFGADDRPLIKSVVSSVDGKKIVIISANCTSLQVQTVSANSRSMHSITPKYDVANVASCPSEKQGFAGVSGAVGLAVGRVAVLFASDPESSEGTQMVVYIGTPGQPFTRTVLLDSAGGDAYGAAIGRDPANGALYVATAAKNGGVSVWYAAASGEPFAKQGVVATVFARSHVTSVAASHRVVLIGAERATPRHVVSLIYRGPDGQWSAGKVGTSGDQGLIVAADPAASHVSLWEGYTTVESGSARTKSGQGVILRHWRKKGVGKKQRYLTAANGYLNGLAVGRHGKLGVSFEIG